MKSKSASLPKIVGSPERGGSGLWNAFAIGLVVALGFSCSKPAPVECERIALVDTAGEFGESSRIEFQWLAIKVGLDSALRTSEGIATHRASEGALDAGISRYRDSMELEGTGVVSKSGCIDWAGSWKAGRFDRAAMVTAFLRELGKDSVTAVEWSEVSDSTSVEVRLRTIYSLPGANGGGIDSLVLRLEPSMVSVAPR
ncbi:MAG: hypothetical protein RL173_2339 [Fibrobacterota bacterium]|jgi:hypothetical protein